MIRKIRFDSGYKNNNRINYSNSISFEGSKMKYGFPRNYDSFDTTSAPVQKEESEPTIVKYGVPSVSNQNEEEFIKSLNEDLFDDDDSVEDEIQEEKSDNEKPSYFKRLWYAILGKDVK